MGDRENKATLERHWTASEAGDYKVEHELYQDDAILEYPQSGERIRGRPNIQAARARHPAKRHFRIDRILGGGDLWVTEYVITYDGKPLNTVSIMEFHEGKVTRETQYFAEPFEPPAYRAGLVEHAGERNGERNATA